MCGILLTYGIDKKNSLRALSNIRHRGPYNDGYIYIDDVGIGMTQLPMKKKKLEILPIKYKSYYVSYNGEIYDKDAISLSKEIKIAIESVLFLKPINGMFALAAYNEEKKEVILARDEFGIKPIYYAINKQTNTLISCSEISPILEIMGSTKVNKSTIAEIVAFGTQAGESTCFSDIFLLEPGNILVIDLNNMKIKRNIFPSLQPHSNDLEELLYQSVSACGDTFRPASLLLSDGIDSNLLLTYLKKDINKYNIIVNDNDGGVNKKNYSKLNQVRLKNENYLIPLEKAILSYAQPCRMSSILMYQELSDFIKHNGSHMVIAGEGADEFFWGYPRYEGINENSIDTLNLIQLFFGNVEESILLLKQTEEKEYISNLSKEIMSTEKNIFELIYFLDKKFSLEPLLRRSDHIMMRNTIETRVPFLHFGIPNLAKSMGIKRVNEKYNKYPLVELIKKRNQQFLIKPKQHFRAPLQKWFTGINFNDHFNANQLEILSSLDISIDGLKMSYQKGLLHQVFISKSMVVWYEKFYRFL